MLNVSDAYKTAAQDDNTEWHAKATVALASGVTLNLTDADIMQSGLDIQDGTSSKDAFEIGSAIIGQLTLKLNNFDGKFDAYDFTGATIVPYVGPKLTDGTIEYLRKGFFTVDKPATSGTTITLTALDNMSKFDAKYLSASTLAYPATLLQILNDVCSICGVSLATTSFTNADYSVATRPTDTSITCREIVSYVAQLAGSFARINNMGALALGWYDIGLAIKGAEADLDGGGFADANSGDEADGGDFFNYKPIAIFEGGLFKYDDGEPAVLSSLSSCALSMDIVRVTGVQIVPTDENETTYFSGNDGYVVSIEKNPLAQDGLDQLVANVAAKIVGLEFMPLTVRGIGDPRYEAGDVLVVNYRGNKYTGILSNLDYSIGEYEEYSSDAESESGRESDRSSVSAKAVQTSKTYTDNKLTSYDLSVRNLSSLMANSMGFYETAVQQDDGSIIEYMHDKPTLAESQIIWKRSADGFAVSNDGGQTWSAGITSDGNAVVKILTALGINADWINAGTLDAGKATIINLVANLITSGKLQSKDGSVYFDLDNNVAAVTKIVGPASWLGMTFITIGPYTEGSTTYKGLNLFENGVQEFHIGSTSEDNAIISTSNLLIKSAGGLTEKATNFEFAPTDSTGSTIFYAGGGDAVSDIALLINSGGTLYLYKGLYVTGNATFAGNLTVSGSKHAVIKTKDYNSRAVNSYETAEVYFGDIGHDTVKGGKCVVPIEPIFAETVNLDVGYEVFLTPYGKGQIYVSERTATSFTVEGNDIDFGWEIKAKRIGYEDVRLEEIKEQ